MNIPSLKSFLFVICCWLFFLRAAHAGDCLTIESKLVREYDQTVLRTGVLNNCSTPIIFVSCKQISDTSSHGQNACHDVNWNGRIDSSRGQGAWETAKYINHAPGLIKLIHPGEFMEWYIEGYTLHVAHCDWPEAPYKYRFDGAGISGSCAPLSKAKVREVSSDSWSDLEAGFSPEDYNAASTEDLLKSTKRSARK